MEENILDAPSLENTEIHKAKLWRRLLASFIDILFLISISLTFRMFNMGNIYLVVVFAVSILYKLGMEYMYGATVGKMIFMIRIVSMKLETLTFAQVVLRNIILLANQLIRMLSVHLAFSFGQSFGFQVPLVLIESIFGLIFCIDVIVLLFNRNDQALHDLMAKTIVIEKGVKR